MTRCGVVKVRSERSERGFTLIELMVVILILGILVAIAVPVYLASQDNAREMTCRSNLRTIDGAIRTFAARYGADPATLDELVPDFLKELPEEPAGGTYNLLAATATEPSQVECSEGHTYPGGP
jgi:prepilin-type N-terminal cleavage/methylation domain-containing protein